MMREALTREQVIMAVERQGCQGIPTFRSKWWGNGLKEKYGARLTDLEEQYPDDICSGWYLVPGRDLSSNGNPDYRFGYRDDYAAAQRHSIGNDAVLLPDWSELDRFLKEFPDPKEPGNFEPVFQAFKNAGGRYKMGCWWRFLHEFLWTVRGMENLMMDYYDNMDGLKIIGEKIVEFDKVIIRRYRDAGCDGIFTSDDLGYQVGPMMSPDIFRELYLPLYKEVVGYTHDLGMHFFLHSCGNNTKLMDHLIEAGVDVFHPVQKGCMDMQETMERFGGRISFLAGLDVQNLLPYGTPEQIREEIRQMRKIFQAEKGGLLLAMGNGILPDTPFENIKAALDEMYA